MVLTYTCCCRNMDGILLTLRPRRALLQAAATTPATGSSNVPFTLCNLFIIPKHIQVQVLIVKRQFRSVNSSFICLTWWYVVADTTRNLLWLYIVASVFSVVVVVIALCCCWRCYKVKRDQRPRGKPVPFSEESVSGNESSTVIIKNTDEIGSEFIYDVSKTKLCSNFGIGCDIKTEVLGGSNHAAKVIPHETIAQATNDFDLRQKVGDGRFGPVFQVVAQTNFQVTSFK